MARQGSGLKSFEWKEWEFFYQKKPVKNLRLRFKESQFYLSVPEFYSLDFVLLFLAKNEEWIRKTYSKFKPLKRQENELIFLNKSYKIIFDEKAKKTYFEKDSIKSPSKEHLELFLKHNAKKIFSFYLKKWSQKTGLVFTHLSIKNMKTRWGSCNAKKGYINLNLRLLSKSLRAIEYVILHELAHIKHPNHSQEFYAFIGLNMSDFRQREMEFKN